MLKSLTLRNRIFPSNIIQGPLAGVSCAPFRLLAWQHSAPAFTYTEMISCKTILHQPQLAYQRFIRKLPGEGALGVQLSGSDPHELAETVKIVTDFDVDLIDLNCGCPVKKIRKKQAGSKLLSDAAKLYQLISAMKNNTHLPVSVKVRVDGASEDQFNHEIAKVVAQAGADFLIVHGRHWTEHYETACRLDQIQFFVNELTIPVIGNGDIACVNSLKNMLNTGCAGVMISRASVGRPWLINQLTAELQQTSFTPPAIKDIGAIFQDHVLGLADLLANEKFALLHARKFAKYYARDLANKLEYVEAMQQCETIEHFQHLCRAYFC